MVKITISELKIADAESFLCELNDLDSIFVSGGDEYAFIPILNYSLKTLEFGLLAYAIYSITSLVSSFNSQEPILYGRNSPDGLVSFD